MDLSDPDTWKLPAALIEHWKTILGGLVVIGGSLGTILRWGLAPLHWLRSKIHLPRHSEGIERPLRFVQDERQSFWGPSARGTEPGTQISGHWLVTNTTDRNILLVGARLDSHGQEAANLATWGFRDQVYSKFTPVPAESIAQVTVSFFCFPPIISGTQRLAVNVIFTDNYEGEHRVPSTFRCIRA